MVYGAEAVLPSDIRHDSPRVANYVEADNEQARQEAAFEWLMNRQRKSWKSPGNSNQTD